MVSFSVGGTELSLQSLPCHKLRRWEQRRKGGRATEAFYRVSPRNRLLVGAVYLGLVAVLVIGMHVAHLPRTLG